MRFTPIANALYLCDNGRCLCGRHLGASAKHTGRDISGQPILRLDTDAIAYYQQEFGTEPACETCIRPSRTPGKSVEETEPAGPEASAMLEATERWTWDQFSQCVVDPPTP